MRNFNTALVLCATIGLGLLLGCATEYPSNLPVSQTHDSIERHTLSDVTLSAPAPAPALPAPVLSAPATNSPKVKSLITLGKDEDLANLIGNAPGVVLVDFYATWCGPCVKQGKVLHGLADFASQKNASIIKVDVDQHEKLASLFDVSALPTLMLIKDGKVVDRQRGLANETRVTELLSR